MVGINDFQMGNWWATVSGAGTEDAEVKNWADDYTRNRTNIEPTYNGTDTLYGRKPIADVNP